MAETPQIKQISYNWSANRAGHTIAAIIAHGTGGVDSRAYLARGGDAADGSDRKVSIHVLIQKPGDTIYRYVPDARGANHAGFGTMPAGFPQVNPNLVTVGLELENLQNGKDPYPDSQLRAMGWQINDWRRLYGPLPVLRHTDIDPSRRSDTVGLSVAAIEQWCVAAAAHYAANSLAVAWGPIATPAADQWGWDNVRCWAAHQTRLGACRSHLLYDNTHHVIMQCFERGAVRQVGAGAWEACYL